MIMIYRTASRSSYSLPATRRWVSAYYLCFLGIVVVGGGGVCVGVGVRVVAAAAVAAAAAAEQQQA